MSCRKKYEKFFKARQSLLKRNSHITNRKGEPRLGFTFDGNLVGDIGEALAVEYFGVTLDETRSTEGIDETVGEVTVQVKATGTLRGPAFRPTKLGADYLLFFCINFEMGIAEVVFNGPEKLAICGLFKDGVVTQRMVTRSRIVKQDGEVNQQDRLPII